MRKVVVVSMLLSLLFVIPIQASIPINDTRIRVSDRKMAALEQEGNSVSAIAYGLKRGTYISTAIMSLKDEGKGKIRITVQTYAHVVVDRIYHTAVLEKLQEDGSWLEIHRNTYDVSKNDVENQDLADLINIYTLEPLEVEQFYRVKGYHYVVMNNRTESLKTTTPMMRIKEYPG